jgi:hypothetical protein
MEATAEFRLGCISGALGPPRFITDVEVERTGASLLV